VSGVKQQNSNRISLTAQADISGYGHGQCVGFVKAVSTPLVATSSYVGGEYLIVDDLPIPGTIIGVFGTPSDPDSTSYDTGGNGYVAIYVGKIPTDNAHDTGIVGLDQNHDDKTHACTPNDALKYCFQ